MARFITPVTNFKSGVLSKKLYSRIDAREHKDGLSVGTNALIGKHGGCYKRLGTEVLNKLSYSTTDGQLEPVTFRKDETMFFLFENGYAWIYNAVGSQVGFVSMGTPTGTNGGYSLAQYKNTVIITHESGKVAPVYVEFEYIEDPDDSSRGIYRPTTKAVGFNLGSPDFSPQTSPNTDLSKKLTLTHTGAGAGTATQTLTGVGVNLEEEFVTGDFITITGLSYINSTAPKISSNIYYVNSIAVGGATAQVSPMYIWNGPSGAYDVMHDLDANKDYTVPAGATSREFTEWSRSVWGTFRSWPKRVAVDEGRVVFANNDEFPATIWGSATGSITSFYDRRVPEITAKYASTTENWGYPYEGDILATDPYNFTMSSKGGGEITFMESARNFIVGTSRQEFVISGNGQALSQYNISIRAHTSHGSSNLSVSYDNSILFVSRNRKGVHQFKYSDENGSFVSREISVLNPDLFENDSIKSISWHDELSTCFFTTDSGKLVSLAMKDDTETTGFTTHEFDSKFTVLDTAYGIGPDGDYVYILMGSPDGVTLERINNYIPEDNYIPAMFDVRKEIRYCDNLNIFKATDTQDIIGNNYLASFDATRNIIDLPPQRFTIGDRIRFTNRTAGYLLSIGLDPALTYYVIPWRKKVGDAGYVIGDEFFSGIKLATTFPLANAGVSDVNLIGGLGPQFQDYREIEFTILRQSSVIPLDDYAEGETIYIWYGEDGVGNVADFEERVITAFEADNDRLTLAKVGHDQIAYGRPYEFQMATMPIEAGQQWGTSMLGCKRVDTAMVRLYDTKSYFIGTNELNLEERTFDDYISTRDDVKIQGTPEYDHIIYISNDKPEPIYVASLALRGVSNDG